MNNLGKIRKINFFLLVLGLVGILHSNIYAGEIEQKAFIERFYQNILNRSSDTEGMNTWMNTIKNQSATQVAMGFLNSPELTNKNLSNEEFLDIMYQTMFDRQADNGGRNNWLEKMRNGRTKQSVMFGFFQSQEFKNLTDSFGVTQILPTDVPSLTGVESYVDRFYKLVLKRNYDENGFDDWVKQLTNKTKNPTEIANGFLFSPEYTNQNEDNSTYLDTCYKAFFNRNADEDGKNDWLNKIANQGYTRQQIFEGFTGSQEFVNLVNSFNLDSNNDNGKITFKGLEYGVVISPITGKKWLDRNLGATEVCSKSLYELKSLNPNVGEDYYVYLQSNCFGDYYQLGRLADGHEKSTSSVTPILAQDITNTESSSFINFTYSSSQRWDWVDGNIDYTGEDRIAQWSKTDGTGICPVGFRVPTMDELKNETISYDGTNENVGIGKVKVINAKTAFDNFLKLPTAGFREGSTGSLSELGFSGGVWTTSKSLVLHVNLFFNESVAVEYFSKRATGASVRCINGN